MPVYAKIAISVDTLFAFFGYNTFFGYTSKSNESNLKMMLGKLGFMIFLFPGVYSQVPC